jgi:CHAT domain-containing protein
VEALGRLYAAEGRVFVGAEATESRAKTASGDARYLHFASHGVTDDRFPLDSYLALGASGEGDAREDGRLQAWEVCEQVRLRADLVVLSACDTGLGAELAGAGLVGLTYAFQYAGARSVVASLWPVSDRSTAPLMRAFHERLRRGERPAEALRAAQLELMSHPIASDSRLAGGLRRLLRMPRSDDLPLDASHPYYWAAFQLFGTQL